MLHNVITTLNFIKEEKERKMENIILIVIMIVMLLILKIILDVNIKKIKEFAENNELDEITERFPENIEICKTILKKLKNENVKIEENKDSDTSLYIALSNKIIIANLRNSYTRIQTIAHECLHSVQGRKIQLFNFIFSNIYFAYFLIITILTLLNKIENTTLQVAILLVLGFIYYAIRSYLETDAMTKARFIAKEYMEESKIIEKSQIDKLIQTYDELNNIGIKAVNYQLLATCFAITIIYCIISLI